MPLGFVCPLCRTDLVDRGDAFTCSGSSHCFPVRWGFPDFSTGNHYWNQLTPDQMEVLLDVAALKGYRYAAESILGRFKDPELTRYVLAANRADFRAILPMTSDTDVLEIGSGWGGVTATLAPHCRTLIALDTNPYTLRFVAMRMKEDGINNVSLAVVDPLDHGRLPLPDGSVELAILNGVLEYVGSAAQDAAPRELQLRGLREVRRVLKPGGAVYVGIENRLSYLYFLGTRDHSGLRYTSLLPRPLASLATWLRRRMPYRTYTYSYRGYRRLLREAGFAPPQVYIAVPNYRDPRFIVPADDNRAIAYLVRRYAAYLRKRSWRAMANALFSRTPDALCGALARTLCDSFLLIAEAPA